jgi:hypothetical protein
MSDHLAAPSDQLAAAASVSVDHGSRSYRRVRFEEGIRTYAWATVAALIGSLIGLYAGYSLADLPIAKQAELPTMTQCVADTVRAFDNKNLPATDALREARNHCYSLIQSQEVLSDFAIRKLNFFQQYRANAILMWMVVLVTFSGVFLAGLQLRASYQLAASSRSAPLSGDGELIVKRDKLILRSSITGLFILLISFCFFLVFVFYVYRFEAATEPNNSAKPPVFSLPTDGLGPPPMEKDKQ